MTDKEMRDCVEDIRGRLAKFRQVVHVVQKASEGMEIERVLDSIIENAAVVRTAVTGHDSRWHRGLVKRIRKALGYTYP